MLITEALIAEHDVFYLLLQKIEQSLSDVESIAALQNRLAAFAFALESHARLEDELLFNALEPYLGTQGGPLAVMRTEHHQIGDWLERIQSASGLEHGHNLTSQLIEIVRGHFRKEEQVLFHMARQFLPEEELSALGAQWTQRRVPMTELD